MSLITISTDVFNAAKSRKHLELKARDAALDMESFLDKIVKAANVSQQTPYNDYQLNVFKKDQNSGEIDRLVLSYTRIMEFPATASVDQAEDEAPVNAQPPLSPQSQGDVTQEIVKPEKQDKSRLLDIGSKIMPIVSGMMSIRHSVKADSHFIIRPVAEIHFGVFNPLTTDIDQALAKEPEGNGMIMEADLQDKMADMIFQWVYSAMPEEHHAEFFSRCEQFGLVPKKSEFGFQKPVFNTQEETSAALVIN